MSLATCIEHQVSKCNVEKSLQSGQLWCGGQPVVMLLQNLCLKGYYFHYSIQGNKVQLTDH